MDLSGVLQRAILEPVVQFLLREGYIESGDKPVGRKFRTQAGILIHVFSNGTQPLHISISTPINPSDRRGNCTDHIVQASC